MPPPVRRALLSVSDKTGLVELARELARRNIEILSTGGTAQLLAANGVAVGEGASYTRLPQVKGGRPQTLHPQIHRGLPRDDRHAERGPGPQRARAPY